MDEKNVKISEIRNIIINGISNRTKDGKEWHRFYELIIIESSPVSHISHPRQSSTLTKGTTNIYYYYLPRIEFSVQRHGCR